jgi:hypothetical protein
MEIALTLPQHQQAVVDRQWMRRQQRYYCTAAGTRQGAKELAAASGRAPHRLRYGQIHSCSYPNPNNYYSLLTLPIPTHTHWITSFVLDSTYTQSIICTLPTPYPPHFFNG